MKFDTVEEAFNHYRNATVEQIEQRAAQIRGTLSTDPNADTAALNIEIEGLKQAKTNAEEKQQAAPVATRSANLNPVTGRSFVGTERKPDDAAATQEYRSAFFKQMLGRDLSATERAAVEAVRAERRADAFSTTGNTAAVIPTQTLNEVISKARKQGGILSRARGFQIPANVVVPVGTPSAAANWHAEGAVVDGEKPDVAEVSFSAREILKVFSISAAVKRMSVSAFESYITDELTASVMACIANSLVNGTGTDQGTGVLSGVTWDATNSAETSRADAIDYADIVKLPGMLARGYGQGACFAMSNKTLYSRIYGLTASDSKPIFNTDPMTDVIGKLLGFDVVVDDFMPDDVVLFGNFSYLGYNLAEGIAVESSTESSFRAGKVDYRALAIADTKPIVPEAFVKLTVKAAAQGGK